MLAIILILTFTALGILCIGFFEIRIPFISMPQYEYQKHKFSGKRKRHDRKMLRKRRWYDQAAHKGFVKLPT